MQTTVTITSKFQVHIPKAIREKAGFLTHGPVTMRADKGMITIKKRKGKGILTLAGAFRVKNPIPVENIRDYIDYSR